MATLTYPRSWAFKPPPGVQVNRGHRLAQNLIHCFLCNEGGGQYLTDVASGRLASNPAPDTDGWIRDRRGPAVQGLTGATNYWQENVPAVISAPFTAVAIFRTTASGYYNGARVLSSVDTFGTPSGMGWCLTSVGGASNATLGYTLVWMASDVTFPSLTMTGTDYFLGAMSMATSNGNVVGYLGNLRGLVKTETSTNTAQLRATGAGAVVVNGSQFANYTSVVSQAMIYNRVLSYAEIQQLNVDPYCFLVPPARPFRYLFGPAAGVAVTRNLLGLDRTVPRHVLRGVMRGAA